MWGTERVSRRSKGLSSILLIDTLPYLFQVIHPEFELAVPWPDLRIDTAWHDCQGVSLSHDTAQHSSVQGPRCSNLSLSTIRGALDSLVGRAKMSQVSIQRQGDWTNVQPANAVDNAAYLCSILSDDSPVILDGPHHSVYRNYPTQRIFRYWHHLLHLIKWSLILNSGSRISLCREVIFVIAVA